MCDKPRPFRAEKDSDEIEAGDRWTIAGPLLLDVVDCRHATVRRTEGEHYRPTMRDDLENSIRSERMFKASFFAGPLSSKSFSSS